MGLKRLVVAFVACVAVGSELMQVRAEEAVNGILAVEESPEPHNRCDSESTMERLTRSLAWPLFFKPSSVCLSGVTDGEIFRHVEKLDTLYIGSRVTDAEFRRSSVVVDRTINSRILSSEVNGTRLFENNNLRPSTESRDGVETLKGYETISN